MIEIIVSIITAVTAVTTAIIANKTNKKIDTVKDLKYDFDKTYLTDFISDVENGSTKSDIQSKIAHEKYDEYIKMGGDSYVHEHWESLQSKELL